MAEIRMVEDDRLEECTQVIRGSFRDVAKQFGLTEENASGNGAFMKVERLRDIIDNGAIPFAVFEGEQIAGFACVTTFRGEYHLEKLAVLPQYRHRGFGELLIAYGCDIAKKMGSDVLFIDIIDENTLLKSWYQKLGFVETEKKHFPPHPFTVCFMQKSI